MGLEDNNARGERARMMEKHTEQASREDVDVSIIVVSWNTKKLLRECLRSVWEATHAVTFEVMVVDNGSRDGSAEMVMDEFPLVNLFQTGSNLGFAKATNIGIRKSSGRYVCLVNSDVVVREGCIDKMYLYLEQHGSAGMLAPRILNPDLTLQRSCRGTLSLWNSLCRALALDTVFPRSRSFGGLLMNYWPHDRTRSVDAILGCFWMIRRKALDEVGLLDERFFMYAEDMDWCQRCRMAGWEVVYFADAEVVHHGGASALSAPIRFYVEANRSSFVYWRKYHGKLWVACIYSVILLGELMRIVRASILSLLKPSERDKARFKLERSLSCVVWLTRSHKPVCNRKASQEDV